MGHSAGAHTVSLLGMDESYLNKVEVPTKSIKGVIPISSPFTLKVSQAPKLAVIFGGSNEEKMCPLNFIDGNEPPFLILQGERDRLVKPNHAKVANEKIKAKNGKVETHYFPNHNHFTIIGAFSSRHEQKGDLVTPILKFIEAHN